MAYWTKSPQKIACIADETKPRYSPGFSFICNEGYSEKRSEQFYLTYTDNVKSAYQVSQRYIGIHRIANVILQYTKNASVQYNVDITNKL